MTARLGQSFRDRALQETDVLLTGSAGIPGDSDQGFSPRKACFPGPPGSGELSPWRSWHSPG
jgi:hypothetical protein